MPFCFNAIYFLGYIFLLYFTLQFNLGVNIEKTNELVIGLQAEGRRHYYQIHYIVQPLAG